MQLPFDKLKGEVSEEERLRYNSYPAALPPGRGVSGFAGNIPYAKERPWALAHSDVAPKLNKVAQRPLC